MSVNRILVLEDDESIATDIQQRLERLGYSACEVVHSHETLLARVETYSSRSRDHEYVGTHGPGSARIHATPL